jgi:hypothetical protein
MAKKTVQDIIAESIETFLEDMAWGDSDEYLKDVPHPTHDDISVVRRNKLDDAPYHYGSTEAYRNAHRKAQGDPSKTSHITVTHVSPSGERTFLGKLVKVPRRDEDYLPTGKHHITVYAPGRQAGKMDKIASHLSDEHDAINALKDHHNLPVVKKGIDPKELD